MQRELFVAEQGVLEEEEFTQLLEAGGDLEAEAEADVKRSEEKPVAEEQAEPGNSGQSTWSPLKVLEVLQLEMEPVNEKARRAFSQLKHRTCQRKKPYLQLRSKYIQHIRGFWSTVVSFMHTAFRLLDMKQFVHHPMLSAMISEEDQDVLSHMTDVKVEEVSDWCKIMLFFCRNPYFYNNVIVKEYLVTISGYKALHSTPVEWKEHYAREVCFLRHHNSDLNFFHCLPDHNLPGSGWIAEIISKDLWPNPLRYYQTTTALGQGSERRREEETPGGFTAVCCQVAGMFLSH
ncbi:testis-specific Y-encoded protein 2-like [Saccopteryx bilineata]|uniref:testis-specific Y-encoded protein 2-like n=1 Tax=Saccopteryx bilineata TaxID=59482 RepID=UPI00338DA32E